MSNPGADGAAKERYDRIRDEIAALPGVVAVGIGSPMPLHSSSVVFEVKAEGKAVDAGEAIARAELRTANPDFFRAAGIPLLSGRPFATTDRMGSGMVVIINQTLADLLFPGEDPVGQRIAWTGDVLRFAPISGDWRTVIGVAGNTQDDGLDAGPRLVVFMPFAQMVAIGGGLVIRAERDVAALVPAATRIVRRNAPTAPIENVMTIAQIKDQSVSPRRLNAVLITSFGVLAVIIAAVGIAGVLAFSVSARTNEIGIRMSLGADSGRVQRMILTEGGTLLAIGLVLGVAGAFCRGARHPRTALRRRATRSRDVRHRRGSHGRDRGGACWIPAARAARIDPAITMRGVVGR
jgi:putative ABC transport system permease protein